MERSLPEISLGNVTFPGNAFLAPLSGITDRSFRRIAERYGAGMVVSEMIASAALATGHEDMHRRLGKPARLPHMVQLAGCEAEWLAEGARIAEDAGAEIIDINMGCPAKRVTNGYAGSALMRVPDIAIGLVEAVVKAVKVPVTVKMRLGWDDADLNAPDIARRAVEAGAQMITVHGRTRQQFYKGEARWAPIRAVRDAIDVPLVVNGDIRGFEDAKRALDLSGADAVMIGRGAQGKPWIVGQIADQLAGRTPNSAPRGDDLAELVVEHYALMLDEYGPELAVRCARKHIGWYLDTLSETAEVNPEQRKAVLTEDDSAVVTRMLGDLFSAANSSNAERSAA